MRAPSQILKADGGVHIVAEHGLPGFKIAVDDALDGFTKELPVFHGSNRNFPDPDLGTAAHQIGNDF